MRCELLTTGTIIRNEDGATVPVRCANGPAHTEIKLSNVQIELLSDSRIASLAREMCDLICVGNAAGCPLLEINDPVDQDEYSED
jgi:hypothetical protein